MECIKAFASRTAPPLAGTISPGWLDLRIASCCLSLAWICALAPAATEAQPLNPVAQARADQAHRDSETPPVSAVEAAQSVTQQAAGLRPGEAATIPVKPRNFIDEALFAKMARDGVPHAGLATDGEFLRRVYLDLIGRIPTLEEVLAFEGGSHAEQTRPASRPPDRRGRIRRAMVLFLRGSVPGRPAHGVREESLPLLDPGVAALGPLLCRGRHGPADARRQEQPFGTGERCSSRAISSRPRTIPTSLTLTIWSTGRMRSTSSRSLTARRSSASI